MIILFPLLNVLYTSPNGYISSFIIYNNYFLYFNSFSLSVIVSGSYLYLESISINL